MGSFRNLFISRGEPGIERKTIINCMIIFYSDFYGLFCATNLEHPPSVTFRDHLPLLLWMSPWTAPAQRLIVTIRLSQEP